MPDITPDQRRLTDNADPATLAVGDLLHTLATRTPDGEMIRSIHQDRSITHAQMHRLCNQMAHYFDGLGLAANDRVVVLGGNDLEYLIFYCGVWRYGAAICTINTEMNAGYLGEILSALRPRLVLYDDSFDPTTVQGVTTALWRRYGAWDERNAASENLFSEITTLPDTPDISPVNGPDDFAAIAFTSGTSSKPKGVIQTYRGVMANGISTSIATDVGPEDRLLEYRALSWASARARLLMALASGATMVVAQKFSQSRFFEWLKDERISIAFCVPTVINMLLERPVNITRRELPSLRFITSSTSPLPPDRHRQFEETYGIPIVQFYGMSEAGNIACNPPDATRMGSVGRPSYLQEFMIVGPDGKPAAAEEIGEITTGGPMSTWGYLNEDGSAEPLGKDRIATGDLGYLDEDGYLFVTGRAKDIIIRGGANIQPLEIDNVLLSHSEVSEAATIGAPDPIYGEEIASFVVPMPGTAPDATTLVDHCRAHLPGAKLPKHIVFVENIAKNDRGKINRPAMKEQWIKFHADDMSNGKKAP